MTKEERLEKFILEHPNFDVSSSIKHTTKVERKKIMPEILKIREYIKYIPSTGEFYRKKKNKGRGKIGIIRLHTPNMYPVITTQNRTYLAHRLAWCMYYNEEPPMLLDHIDGDKLNYKICNLRKVTYSENRQNQFQYSEHNKSKLLGVVKTKNKWLAKIGINGSSIFLGSFNSPEEAGEAYLEAKKIYHPSAPTN